MTDDRPPKVIVELREQFHREATPTPDRFATIWSRLEKELDREDEPKRWAIEHAGAPANVPARFTGADVPMLLAWILAFGFAVFAVCGGVP